jgi:hypothetical protein
MQAPRNDFTLLLQGASLSLTDRISLVPNSETCASNGNSFLDSTHTSNTALVPLGSVMVLPLTYTFVKETPMSPFSTGPYIVPYADIAAALGVPSLVDTVFEVMTILRFGGSQIPEITFDCNSWNGVTQQFGTLSFVGYSMNFIQYGKFRNIAGTWQPTLAYAYYKTYKMSPTYHSNGIGFYTSSADSSSRVLTFYGRMVSAAVSITATHAVPFEWVTNLCVSTLNGVLGHVMPDTACPQIGWYRLCYTQGSNTPSETGISVYIQQAQVVVTTPFFTNGMVHEVNTLFSMVVQLRDQSNQPCCAGTKVHLSLTKDGADHSSFLYSPLGSNLPADKIVVAEADGVATFAGYTIRRTAGINFYFTASVAGHFVNIPANVSGVQGVFQVRPSRLTVTTPFSAEYIVGANLTATLPAAVTVRAEDIYGNLLVGLNASDNYHCEVQLQTGRGGTDSRWSGTYGGIKGQMTTGDLSPLDVQNGGAQRPVFDQGIVVVENMQILNQAGWYVPHECVWNAHFLSFCKRRPLPFGLQPLHALLYEAMMSHNMCFLSLSTIICT